jgi:hypothetical protein
MDPKLRNYQEDGINCMKWSFVVCTLHQLSNQVKEDETDEACIKYISVNAI